MVEIKVGSSFVSFDFKIKVAMSPIVPFEHSNIRVLL